MRIVNDIKIVRVGGRADQNCTMRGKQGDERGGVGEEGAAYRVWCSLCWLHQYIKAAMHMIEEEERGNAPPPTKRERRPRLELMRLALAITAANGEMIVHHLTHLLPRLLSSSTSTP